MCNYVCMSLIYLSLSVKTSGLPSLVLLHHVSQGGNTNSSCFKSPLLRHCTTTSSGLNTRNDFFGSFHGDHIKVR